MSSADEKFCLQWNDFKANVTSAFGDLRQDKEFTDVTLSCEDGQQVEAHKVVLLASSPFFQNILKRNKHPHPLIYMRGVSPENLMAMVDFFYHGETNVYQENLDSFLVLAEELQLKGLRGNQTESKAEVFLKSSKQRSQPKSPKCSPAIKQFPVNEDVANKSGLMEATIEKYSCEFCYKRFPTPSKLQRHQLVHSGEKPYLCFICLKGFTQRVHLNTHKKHSHPGQEGVEGGEGGEDMDTEGSEEGSLAIAEH